MTFPSPYPTHCAAPGAPRLAAVLFALSCGSAVADIVAAPHVPAELRPQIGAGAGATRIDIAPPNASGVSLNQYHRFDVDAAGAVLNNAVGDARSELLGDIAANARLNGRAAQIIVNQVLSDDPSTLRGMLEVAGARADVIVANPHGIRCDGCGFIGTGRTTLLVGDALLDADSGALRTLSAADGDLRIGAAGLRDHARAAERIDLIARRIAVAGRVDARELRLVAGMSRVDAVRGDVQAMAVPAPEMADGLPEQPAYALDVAAAGAMHAGRIHLIATEAGAGVRSAGELRAYAQDLRLDVGGALRLANAYARRDLQIEAAGRVDVERGAVLSAERDLTLRSADLVTLGAITADGDLRLDVADLYNGGGTLRSGRDMRLRSASNLVNGRQSWMTVGGTLHAAVAREFGNYGAVEGAALSLQAVEACINRGGTLKSAQGDIDVTALSFDNRSGTTRAAAALHVRLPVQGSFYNAGGVIQAGPGTTKIASGMLGNAAGGTIEVAGDLQARVSDLLNSGGTVQVGGQAQIECRDKLANGAAQIRSARALTLRVGSEADNDLGTIESRGDLQFTLGGILSNVGGRIGAEQGALRLQAPTAIIVNDGGDIGATHALHIDSASLSNGRHSRIIGDDVSLRVGEMDNVAGRVVAQRTLRIAASAIDNSGGGRLVAGDDAVFDVDRRLFNSGGRIHVHGDELVMRVPRGEIDNRGGELRLPLAQPSWFAQTVLGELRPAHR